MKDTSKITWKYALKSTLPVMAGYLVLGAGFGILLESKGYGWWWAALMSITIYAGSMQYIAVDLLANGVSLIAAAIMTLMVNMRHVFYGLAMIEKYKNIGKMKPYVIFALTDETFSLVCENDLPEEVDQRKYYIFVSILDQMYWIIGCILGGVIGSSIVFNSAGIDFAMTALFVVIFVEQWEKTRQHLPALTGVIISIASVVVFGADGFLIPAMIFITIGLFIQKKWIKETNDD